MALANFSGSERTYMCSTSAAAFPSEMHALREGCSPRAKFFLRVEDCSQKVVSN